MLQERGTLHEANSQRTDNEELDAAMAGNRPKVFAYVCSFA